MDIKKTIYKNYKTLCKRESDDCSLWYSLWEIIGWLEERDYPEGTLIKDINGKIMMTVLNRRNGVRFIDKYEDTIPLSDMYFKTKYSKPIIVKNIYRNEILAKFECEEFKIVD